MASAAAITFAARPERDSHLMKRVLREKWLRVAPSKTHGTGVFAARPLKAGLRLGYYRGEVLTDAQASARYADTSTPCHYVLALRNGAVNIDARDPATSNWTRYVNSPEGTRHAANCCYTGCGIVRTTAAIAEGEELLVNYGVAFTKAMLQGAENQVSKLKTNK